MILARSRDRAVAQTFKSPNFQPPFSLPGQRLGFVVDKVPLGQMLLEETQPLFYALAEFLKIGSKWKIIFSSEIKG